MDFEKLPSIRYETHADNAPIRKGAIKWKEIRVINKYDKEVHDPMAPPSLY